LFQLGAGSGASVARRERLKVDYLIFAASAPPVASSLRGSTTTVQQWRRAFRSSRTSNAFDLASMSGWLVPVCSRSRGPHCSLQRCSVMTISPPLVPWNRSHQEAGKQKGHPNIRWPVPLSFRNLKVPHIEQPLAAQGTVASLDARLSGSALRLNRS